ncbi:short-chain dehydrogenase [Anopheles darlingi]|uniref:Short-chain dehydrogenase n=1 Tax=Anopheles darlingi TaxID=43151 RepID=W5JBA0_ANODA|nr:short-chain dehydrogenase [Anopheles darlingi]
MEVQTALVLTIQLIALFSIAGALLLYLLCKVRGTRDDPTGVQKGSILVTCADTALGLQICTFFASKGHRVFAGMKDPVESLPAKLLRGWMKMRENSDTPVSGSVVPMKIDVTREDVLREAAESMGAHLNAGERGILAVINTAGSVYRGRIDSQDSLQWENMFKNNVMGCLRTARAFIGLLRPTRGRLILLGSGNDDDGLTVFMATRNAVQGCADALRKELRPYGVSVVTLDSRGVPAESLFKAPVPYTISDEEGVPTQYSADVLTSSALGVIERALYDNRPSETYCLSVPNSKFQKKGPSQTLKAAICHGHIIPRERLQSIIALLSQR